MDPVYAKTSWGPYTKQQNKVQQPSLYVPWSRLSLLVLGMGDLPPLIGILIMGPYKPLLLGWWVYLLLYGNNRSLDPGTYVSCVFFGMWGSYAIRHLDPLPLHGHIFRASSPSAHAIKPENKWRETVSWLLRFFIWLCERAYTRLNYNLTSSRLRGILYACLCDPINAIHLATHALLQIPFFWWVPFMSKKW